MTRKNAIRLLTVIAVLLFGLGYVFFTSEKIIFIAAKEGVPLLQNPARPATGKNVVHVFSVGERASVVGCEDFKTDIAIKVRTQSGKVGFVSDFDFSLERRRPSLRVFIISPNTITWSCRGWFENHS